MEAPVEEPQEEEELTLGLNWRIPDTIVSRYATNMLIQEAANEYIIMFFEAHPPVILTHADLERQRTKRPPVDAECVARIIVARDRLQHFIDVWQRILDRSNVLEESEEE